MSKIKKFYVASKIKYAELWRTQRDRLGHNIISTWIDEAEEGQTNDYSELACRCITEIKKCDILLLYCKPGEVLKGALIEAGAALALGKEIRCVGSCESLSRIFIKHNKWRQFQSLFSAFST